MVQIKYQLTFEEYREGMMAVQKRYGKRVAAEARKSWFLLFALLIGIAMAAGLVYFRSRGQLALHLFWIAMIVLIYATVFISALRLRRRTAERLWDGLVDVQQPHTAEFDEQGVYLVTPLSEKRTRWAYYSEMEETLNAFLLFVGDFAAEIFPRRAFEAATSEEFRRLARRQLAPSTRAFPVLPMAGGEGDGV